MSWRVVNRNEPPPRAEEPALSEALRAKIRGFFGRYETKRAALLPALHLVQDELGWISWQAQEEVAELLGLPASDVQDVVTFYSHFWTQPRGRKTVVVCRSIACELLGANEVLEECRRVLGIGEHQTTADGEYSLMTEECLAACCGAPATPRRRWISHAWPDCRPRA